MLCCITSFFIRMEEKKQWQDIHALLWPNHTFNANCENQQRWYTQGLDLSSVEWPVGILQKQGGPCGVLAAIQAEMLCFLLFQETGTNRTVDKHGLPFVEDSTPIVLTALKTILCRALEPSGTTVYICTTTNTGDPSLPCQITPTTREGVNDLLLQHWANWTSPMGVILLVYSIMLTRGLDHIRADMDDMDGTLTGTFGYCSQELLNLCLCGKAVSNVFDGEMPVGEGEGALMLRGIPARGNVGYLSHLEALRYCQVGRFYKFPKFPIWVVGSSSHFTLLFGTDVNICTERDDVGILHWVQAAFLKQDPSQNGYFPISQWNDFFNDLQLVPIPGMNMELLSAELCQALTIEGAGIVLWEGVWKMSSVLLNGGTMQEAHIAMNENVPKSSPAGLKRSDSDVARSLSQEQARVNSIFDWKEQTDEQADLDAALKMSLQDSDVARSFAQEQNDSDMALARSLSMDVRDSDMAHSMSLERSDSDIARELQAQWNAEPDYALMDTGTEIVHYDDEKTPKERLQHLEDGETRMSVEIDGIEMKPAAEVPPSTPSTLRTFSLFHYNGLTGPSRNPVLSQGSLSYTESSVIGVPVPLVSSSIRFDSTCPLNEVLQTRWAESSATWFNKNTLPKLD